MHLVFVFNLTFSFYLISYSYPHRYITVHQPSRSIDYIVNSGCFQPVRERGETSYNTLTKKKCHYKIYCVGYIYDKSQCHLQERS